MDTAVLVSIASVLLVAVLTHFTPRLTRPELFFGVTVRADFRDSDKGRRLLRLFQVQLWIFTAVAVLIAIAARDSHPAVSSGAALWWLIASGSLAWYLVNRRARAFAVTPSSEREAAISSHEVRLPGNWLVKAGPFLILGSTLLYLYLNFATLPDPYPVHWNLVGQADRFVPKTLKNVLSLPLIGVGMCAMMAGIAFSLARSSRRISLIGSAGRKESRFRGLNFAILLGAQYYVAVINGWLSIAYQLPYALPFAHYAFLVMTFVPIVVVLCLTFRYGQGGARLTSETEEPLQLGLSAGTAPIGDRTPDGCWKLGLFYYNPGDPALWIEKRAGIGYTLNFGRPLAWVLCVVLIAGPILLTQFLSH